MLKDLVTTGSPPTSSLFRDGMSRVLAAVHVITTDGPLGQAGFTATAVAPVTDDPPTMLVCINAAGRSARLITANGAFCINALSADDQAVAKAFSGQNGLEPQARFATGRWGRLATGAPVLETALTSFDCRLVEARLVSTHYVVIGEVVGMRTGSAGAALIYGNRSYGTVALP